MLKPRVIRSNNKHKELQAKHLKSGKSHLALYHDKVKHKQVLLNRVLNSKEKKELFERTRLIDADERKGYIPF